MAGTNFNEQEPYLQRYSEVGLAADWGAVLLVWGAVDGLRILAKLPGLRAKTLEMLSLQGQRRIRSH